jgi:hypothetical protein
MRSRFRPLEYILPMFLLRPVRCEDCYRRRYIPLFYETQNWAAANEEPVMMPQRKQQPPSHRRSA